MIINVAKEHAKLSGIYSITNTSNGKIYWGQTKHFLKRAVAHCSSLIKNNHRNPYLQNAYNLDNNAFIFRVYLIESDKTKKDSIEEELIELFGNNCYNIQTKAVPDPSIFSHTPEETRAKMTAAQKARHAKKPVSEETRVKMSVAQKGIPRGPVSEEARAKMSVAQKGKVMPPFSTEHRAKLSASAKARWAKKNIETQEAMLNMDIANDASD